MRRLRFLLVAVCVLAGVGSRHCCLAQTGTFVDRRSPTDLRIALWNIYFDSIIPGFPDNRTAKFNRVAAAVKPDIWCFEELYDSTATQLKTLLDAAQPLGTPNGWFVYKPNEHAIASKYPLTMTRSNVNPAGYRPVGIAMVDLPDAQFSSDLYLMNAHYKCCDGFDPERQMQSDAFVNWMRDARTTGGSVNVPQNTPMVLLGDFNLVDGPQPLTTLLDGDIQNNAVYGVDSAPDWDGTGNVAVAALHNAVGPATYTWRNDNSGFAPGRLDYVTFTNSVLSLQRSFALNTVSMTSAQRSATGLQTFDSILDNSGRNYDHLPIIADFKVTANLLTLPGDTDGDYDVDIEDYNNVVNHFGALGGSPGDTNGDGNVDAADLQTVRSHFGNRLEFGLTAVPEPNSMILIASSLAALIGASIRRRLSI